MAKTTYRFTKEEVEDILREHIFRYCDNELYDNPNTVITFDAELDLSPTQYDGIGNEYNTMLYDGHTVEVEK